MPDSPYHIERRKVLTGLASAGVGSALAGCAGTQGGDGDGGGGGDTETYFGVEGPFPDSLTGTAWGGWENPSVSGEFEARTDIDMSVPFIGSDVEGFNAVQSGNEFKFIIPDNIWIQRLGEADLAKPIDEELYSEELSAIPDFIKNHRTMFHDDTRYGIPPRWGVSGIIYNKENISEQQAQEYAVFWDEDMEGRTMVYDPSPLFTVPQIVMYLERAGELSLGLEDMNRDEATKAVYDSVLDHYETIRQATTEMFRNAKLLVPSVAEANRPMLDGTVDVFNGFLLNYAQLKILEEELGQDKIGFAPTPGLGGVIWIEGFVHLNNAEDEATANAVDAWGKWILSERGQKQISWTANRKSAIVNWDAFGSLSDRKKELLFYDDAESIYENSVDYIPQNDDQWIKLWEEAKQKQ
jgi:spermidine/putrescine-binding protein